MNPLAIEVLTVIAEIGLGVLFRQKFIGALRRSTRTAGPGFCGGVEAIAIAKIVTAFAVVLCRLASGHIPETFFRGVDLIDSAALVTLGFAIVVGVTDLQIGGELSRSQGTIHQKNSVKKTFDFPRKLWMWIHKTGRALSKSF